MTIHLVYPNSSQICTPDAIGRHLTDYLRRTHTVEAHQWDELYRIEPSPGDVLLGHAHPSPSTVFRRSMNHPAWRRIILMQPFNHCLRQMGWLHGVVKQCDWYLAITGRDWIDRISESALAGWAPKIVQLDLAVNPAHFPRLKYSYSQPYARRFLYIGHKGPGKNWKYFQALAHRVGAERFGTVGVRIPGVACHGRQDFSRPAAQDLLRQYDFLVVTSDADANPTVVLEAMAWGLIPVITSRCGYPIADGIEELPLNSVDAACATLRAVDRLPDAELLRRADLNRKRLASDFTWERFGSRVAELIASDQRGGPVVMPLSSRLQLARAALSSPYSPWRRRRIRLALASLLRGANDRVLGYNPKRPLRDSAA